MKKLKCMILSLVQSKLIILYDIRLKNGILNSEQNKEFIDFTMKCFSFFSLSVPKNSSRRELQTLKLIYFLVKSIIS